VVLSNDSVCAWRDGEPAGCAHSQHVVRVARSGAHRCLDGKQSLERNNTMQGRLDGLFGSRRIRTAARVRLPIYGCSSEDRSKRSNRSPSHNIPNHTSAARIASTVTGTMMAAAGAPKSERVVKNNTRAQSAARDGCLLERHLRVQHPRVVRGEHEQRGCERDREFPYAWREERSNNQLRGHEEPATKAAFAMRRPPRQSLPRRVLGGLRAAAEARRLRSTRDPQAPDPFILTARRVFQGGEQ
jgi:hypothetical protein